MADLTQGMTTLQQLATIVGAVLAGGGVAGLYGLLFRQQGRLSKVETKIDSAVVERTRMEQRVECLEESNKGTKAILASVGEQARHNAAQEIEQVADRVVSLATRVEHIETSTETLRAVCMERHGRRGHDQERS